MDDVITNFAGNLVHNARVVLLVDELEGSYKTLQQKVETSGDRSPLRELFEARLFNVAYLKFFALAPAGIYEMGGADQTRALRLVSSTPSVIYIQRRLPTPGRANACWWLSRGKARHLFKACMVEGAPADLSATQVAHIVRDELDHIGQPPTEVPPAVTEHLSPSKLPFLMDIAPAITSPRRCYHIDLGSLDEGQMAERFSEAVGLNTDVSLLFAEYFRTTALALSDERCRTFIPDNELPDLLALSLDHLLEYEYGNPQLAEHMGDVLALYERFRSDPGTVHGIIGRLWENKQSDILLPLSIGEIRQLFPFPLMNPIVRQHDPNEMQKKWEGKGFPLWKWSTHGATCWFFASSRDYAQFVDSDDFVSTVLPDGETALCLFPSEQVPRTDSGLVQWCLKNNKVKLESIPQLLADFLFSGTGDLTAVIPGNLQAYIEEWKSDRADVLLSRKTQIYSDALMEIVRTALPQPKCFCKDTPPDAESVWGGSRYLTGQ